MIKIKQNLVSSSKYSIKCPYSMKPEYITYHNTYNDATAENEIRYMISNSHPVSYHFAIDDKEVVQGLPLSRNGFHAGDGQGNGNRKSIGVEVCYSKSGGDRYYKAEKLANKFIAQLLHERGWGVDRVKRHFDWSRKNCPHRILDEGRWNEVLRDIQNELNKLKGASTSPSTPKPPSPSKKPAPSKPAQSGDGSIVDYMNSNKMDSSFKNRSRLAKQYGIANYSGTAFENTQLLSKIKSNSKPSTNSKPTPSAPKPQSTRALRIGDSGSEVRKMQEDLAKAHFYPEKGEKNNGIDGYFGRKTEDALKRFQSVYTPNEVDGYYGAKTKAALEKVNNKK